MADTPFSAYDGDGPYVFVSYAHENSDQVFRELTWLADAGVNVWYDEGIAPGSHWPESLATAIDDCSLFVVFLTLASVRSDNCINEIDYALNKRRPVLWVELEPVELPRGLALSIGNRQGILKHRLTESDYRQKLLRAIENPSTAATRPHVPRSVVASPPRAAVGIGLALLAAVVVYAAVAFYSSPRNGEPDGLTSVAVLPFENMSADEAQNYLADGLADELINQLGRVPDLSVASRTSSFYYKTHPPLMEDIRQRLGVEFAVEGSVSKDDRQLTINTNLFATDTGRQVWSDSFKASLDSVSTVPVEVARLIVEVLAPHPASESTLSQGARVDAGAYDAYLRGLDFLRRPPTPEVLNAAIVHFEQALKNAPDYARAYAALCDTHLTYYRMVRSENADEHVETAEAFCRQSLDLDGTLWEGRQSLAMLYRHTGRFDTALEQIRLADALHPNTASIHHEMGKALAELDEPAQAEAALRRAIELDAGFWGGYADLGDFLYVRGRYDEALQQFSKVQELSPDNGLVLVSLGATHYLLDDRVAAETVWRQAVRQFAGSESRAYWQAATWLGINALMDGCFGASAYWQRQALDVSPNDHRLWGRFAESCELQTGSTDSATSSGAYQRAIALAEAELAINPNDWESLGLLAIYRSRLGGNEPTSELVQRMLELQPDNPDALEIALTFAAQIGDERARESLTGRLLEFGYPQRLLDRNPFLSMPRTCTAVVEPTESWDCAN